MSSSGYTVLAYVIAAALLWGYAVLLGLSARRLGRTGSINPEKSDKTGR